MNYLSWVQGEDEGMGSAVKNPQPSPKTKGGSSHFFFKVIFFFDSCGLLFYVSDLTEPVCLRGTHCTSYMLWLQVRLLYMHNKLLPKSGDCSPGVGKSEFSSESACVFLCTAAVVSRCHF